MRMHCIALSPLLSSWPCAPCTERHLHPDRPPCCVPLPRRSPSGPLTLMIRFLRMSAQHCRNQAMAREDLQAAHATRRAERRERLWEHWESGRACRPVRSLGRTVRSRSLGCVVDNVRCLCAVWLAGAAAVRFDFCQWCQKTAPRSQKPPAKGQGTDGQTFAVLVTGSLELTPTTEHKRTDAAAGDQPGGRGGAAQARSQPRQATRRPSQDFTTCKMNVSVTFGDHDYKKGAAPRAEGAELSVEGGAREWPQFSADGRTAVHWAPFRCQPTARCRDRAGSCRCASR